VRFVAQVARGGNVFYEESGASAAFPLSRTSRWSLFDTTHPLQRAGRAVVATVHKIRDAGAAKARSISSLPTFARAARARVSRWRTGHAGY